MKDRLKARIKSEDIASIARVLAEQAWDTKIEDHNKALHGIADHLETTIFTPDVTAQIKALPEGWLPVTTNLIVKFIDADGNSTSINYDAWKCTSWKFEHYAVVEQQESYITLNLSDYMRIPSNLQGKYGVTIPASSAQAKAIIAHLNGKADCQAKKKQMLDEMIGIVQGLRTWRGLYDQWPEVRELVSDLEPEEPKAEPMLPSTNFSKYNELLGLKVA